MTIPAADTEVAYAGDGVTLSFPIPFVFDTSADITVISTAADGTPTQLTTGFSITGGGGATGTCTFLVAPAALTTITLLDDPELTQTADYISNDAFPADAHEAALDRTVRQVKRLAGRVARSIRVADGDNSSGDDLLLPIESARASKFLAFDVDGQPVASAGTGGGDSALRTDLASGASGSAGAQLVNTRRSEAGSVAVPLNTALGRLMYADDFGANTTPGTTDRRAAIQAAIDAATDVNSEIYLHDDNALGGSLLVRSTTQQNASLIGRGRVSTILRPNAVSIASGAVNVNALIVNQSNNGHTHLRNLRWMSATTPGFTGTFVDALEGGGADGSLQAGFSWTWENVWLSPQSTNGGGAHGGFSNLRTIGVVGESIKSAVWLLAGAGNSDHHHTDGVLNASFDALVDSTALTAGTRGAMIHINGLHAYQHFRGPALNLAYVNTILTYSVAVEADVAHVGTVSLGKYHNCKDVLLIGGVGTTGNGTPRIANGLEFSASVGETCTATVVGYRINADVGLRTSGAGTLHLTFVGVDFSMCQYAWQHLSGNTAGSVTFIDCKMNFCEYLWLLSAGTPTFDINWHGGELLDAGYPNVATGRNIAFGTAGAIRIIGAKIGRTDATNSDATYFILNTGAGTFKLLDVLIVGTPPTGLIDPASTAAGATIQLVRERSSDPGGAKTFAVAVGTNNTVVADTEVQAGCQPILMPSNAKAGAVMGSAQSLYVSARTAGVSFTVSTADGTNIAGSNANFAYRINP